MTEVPVHEDTTVPIESTLPRELTYYEITGVDTTTDSFTIAYDKTDTFSDGQPFEVVGSSSNDGEYTVSSVSYSITDDETTMTVEENVSSSTADGVIKDSEVALLVGDNETEYGATIERAGNGTTDVAAPLSGLSLSEGDILEIHWKITYGNGTVEILPPDPDLLVVDG